MRYFLNVVVQHGLDQSFFSTRGINSCLLLCFAINAVIFDRFVFSVTFFLLTVCLNFLTFFYLQPVSIFPWLPRIGMVVQYCRTYTDRKDGKTLNTIRTVRTNCKMALRTVRTVRFVKMIYGS